MRGNSTPFIEFDRVTAESGFPRWTALNLPENKGVADEGELVACSLRSCQRTQGTLVNMSRVVGEL
jgi:hypothetical protein